MPSLIRATNLWGFDELVRKLGGDPAALLARHKIPSAANRDDNAFVIYRNMAALFEDTAKTLEYPEFGLVLAEYQGMDILGPISVIARSSATVGEALDSIARYLHLHCPALGIRSSTETQGRSRYTKLEYWIEDGATAYSVQAYELGLANAMQVMKLLLGEAHAPTCTYFIHTQSGSEETYRKVFNSPVEFNQSWCGFLLPDAISSIPLSSVDHQTWQLAELYLDSQQTPYTESLSEDVTRLIRGLLPTGQCSNDAIAAHLSLHKRTLQRRLAAEGTSYEKLLTAERQAMAKSYLLEPNLKLSQISGLLGYSEQSAFNRACKDWFGTTPRTYRRQLLSLHG
ncbi:AraC family transcriptional regulator [Microbulbifer aggregans]|uniref:AraC family transcriptional regulator n=1 Tax=Microbulbifer aggregans TaxID=1769779 RepID=UPI001CFDABD9|nr:AraC family transcriptional regulator [Microbulbifer aggregans]